MRLETERLILRELVQDDFDDLFSILSDAETMRYYDAPFDSARVKKWIKWNIENYKTFGFGLFAVILRENGSFIGDCGITMQIINGWIRPGIGYHIYKPFQNRGYGAEAVRKCRDYIFEKTPFNAVYSYMSVNDADSARIAVKNGMRLLGTYADSAGKQLKAYAISRAVWQERKFGA